MKGGPSTKGSGIEEQYLKQQEDQRHRDEVLMLYGDNGEEQERPAQQLVVVVAQQQNQPQHSQQRQNQEDPLEPREQHRQGEVEYQSCEEDEEAPGLPQRLCHRTRQLQQLAPTSSSSILRPGAIAVSNSMAWEEYTDDDDTIPSRAHRDDDATIPSRALRDRGRDQEQHLQSSPIQAYRPTEAQDEDHIRVLNSQLVQIGREMDRVSSCVVRAVPVGNNDGGDDGQVPPEADLASTVASGATSAAVGSSRLSSISSILAVVSVFILGSLAVVVAIVVVVETISGGQRDGPSVFADRDSIEDNPSCFETTQELYDAVDSYLLLRQNHPYNDVADPRSNLSNSSLAIKYGWPIGVWCVGRISDFSSVFSVARNSLSRNFNDDISTWDTSNATTMLSMFNGSSSFDGYLGDWNVSKVVNMRAMFRGARSFTGNGGGHSDSNRNKVGLSVWDVSNVVSLSETFSNAPSFVNGNISSWDVSRVEVFRNVFSSATESYFNDDVSKWDVSNGVDFSSAFKKQVNFNSDLSSWDVSNAINMESMFEGASSFVAGPNAPISNWDVSQVTSMRMMFADAKLFVGGNISHWNVSKVENFEQTFQGCNSFNVDISKWDVSAATDLQWMFDGASSFRQDLCGWGDKLVNVLSSSPSSPSSRVLRWRRAERRRLQRQQPGGGLHDPRRGQEVTAPRSALDQDAVFEMFLLTSCPSTAISPDLGADPPGPFCVQCAS